MHARMSAATPEGSFAVQGPRAVLGPGTGLGEAQLIWDEKFEGMSLSSVRPP